MKLISIWFTKLRASCHFFSFVGRIIFFSVIVVTPTYPYPKLSESVRIEVHEEGVWFVSHEEAANLASYFDKLKER